MYLIFHISTLKLATSNIFLKRTQSVLTLIIIFLGQQFITLDVVATTYHKG